MSDSSGDSSIEYIVDSAVHKDGIHEWHVAQLTCEIEKEDPLVRSTVDYLRVAYGEEAVLGEAVSSVEERFDLSRIREAIRKGYPDSAEEGKQPQHLKNFRSETAELLAKKLLGEIVGIEFPIHGQATKRNPNQQVLGFDGAGFLQIGSEYYLALMEVKGTEGSPELAGEELIKECVEIPDSEPKISSSLTMLAVRLEGTEFYSITLKLLQELSEGRLEMVVAPVIVKGTSVSSITDLEPIIDKSDLIEPNRARGMSVGLGVNLTEFSEVVTSLARSSNRG